MSIDPYSAKKLDTKYPCVKKTVVNGKLCVILDARSKNRALELVQYPSRAVLKNEIHELILTKETTAEPGTIVNDISYLGYFEVLESGVLWVGDKVFIGKMEIGVLAGYDMTHFPNHINIIIKTERELFTGSEINFDLGQLITFVYPER
ncbi:MAG TPA: hypothetical protein DCK95_08430 [Anaerolineaceae bacterium]|nr:hypothetical protein [Anaerolineaceae bacterium]